MERSFETTFEVNEHIECAIIYVVRGGSGNLLGKDTAVSLGILKIGVDINSIDDKINLKLFPKFKGILAAIS